LATVIPTASAKATQSSNERHREVVRFFDDPHTSPDLWRVGCVPDDDNCEHETSAEEGDDRKSAVPELECAGKAPVRSPQLSNVSSS